MEIEFNSAIYKITRLAVHKSSLKYGKQPNNHLQSAYDKYGSDCFKFEVLEYVLNKHDLLKREQIWINYFQSYDRRFGYNKRQIPNSNIGVKRPHSKETKLKIGLANSKSQLGKTHSEITKLKMSLAKKGKSKSEQAKANMRVAWARRKQLSNGWSSTWL